MLSEWLSAIALVVTLLAWFGIKPNDFELAARKYVFKSRYTAYFFFASFLNIILLTFAVWNKMGWLDYSIYLWGILYLTLGYLDVLIPAQKIYERVFKIVQSIFPLIALAWAFVILRNIFNSNNLPQYVHSTEFRTSLIKACFFLFLSGFMSAGNIILNIFDKKIYRLSQKIENLDKLVDSIAPQIDKSSTAPKLKSNKRRKQG